MVRESNPRGFGAPAEQAAALTTIQYGRMQPGAERLSTYEKFIALNAARLRYWTTFLVQGADLTSGNSIDSMTDAIASSMMKLPRHQIFKAF